MASAVLAMQDSGRNRPKLAESGWMFAEMGPNPAECAQIWGKLGHLEHRTDQNSSRIRPTSTRFGPEWLGILRNWPGIDQIRARTRPDSSPNAANTSTKVGPDSTKLGPKSVKVARCRRDVARLGARHCTTWAKPWPGNGKNLGCGSFETLRLDRVRSKFGPTEGEAARRSSWNACVCVWCRACESYDRVCHRPPLMGSWQSKRS